MIDFDKLNSATKYPSIPTYHQLNAGGVLDTETTVPFTGEVLATEKVDGTNARIVLMPNGDYIIGSREELLYAHGDRVINPALGIVDALKPVADNLKGDVGDRKQSGHIVTFFLEVYGHKIGPAAKNYTSAGAVGHRMFDISFIPEEVLSWQRDRIAAWREAGGPKWAREATLLRASDAEGIPLTPRLFRVGADELPSGEGSLERMFDILTYELPQTYVALDDAARTEFAEGIVFRTLDRSVIAKARFEDYRRTKRKGHF